MFSTQHPGRDGYRPLFVYIVSGLGIAACMLFAAVNVARGIPLMVVADSLGALILGGNLLAYLRHQRASVAGAVGCSAVAVLVTLGAHFVGVQVLALLAPLCVVAFFLLGQRGGAVFVLLTMSLVAVWFVLGGSRAGGMPPIDIFVSLLLVGVIGYFYESIRTTYARDLVRLSTTDPLTGALNRRRAEVLLDEELGRADRYRRPLSLALVDVDHFKRINDRWGHVVGDDVLRETVSRLGATLRKEDALVRWGGEEFLVLLPETKRQGARIVADRLRRVVEGGAFGPGVTVTVSIGVATARGGDDQDSLVRRADERLYRAKREGRNRVVGGHDSEAASGGVAASRPPPAAE